MEWSNSVYFTSNNPLDKSFSENEDAIRVEILQGGLNKLVALSDGAGGVGIYCKQWAEFIVNKAPTRIPNYGLDSWFLEISKEFYKNYQNYDFPDIETKEKFISSGSYATMLFLWIDYDNKVLKYIGVGDTSVFLLRNDANTKSYRLELIYPIDSNEYIDQNPKLLNWRKSSSFREIREINLETGDIILAGTDSISRWVLENLLILNQNETLKKLNPNFKINNWDLEKHKFRYDGFTKVDDIFKSIPKEKDMAIEYFVKIITDKYMDADDITLFAELIQ